MKATFQSVLERWIGDRGYEAVAPLLGASISTVHSWRHGSTVPALTRVPALAAALGVSETKLRRVIEAERKHRTDRGASATTATVDEAAANEVSP